MALTPIYVIYTLGVGYSEPPDYVVFITPYTYDEYNWDFNAKEVVVVPGAGSHSQYPGSTEPLPENQSLFPPNDILDSFLVPADPAEPGYVAGEAGKRRNVYNNEDGSVRSEYLVETGVTTSNLVISCDADGYGVIDVVVSSTSPPVPGTGYEIVVELAVLNADNSNPPVATATFSSLTARSGPVQFSQLPDEVYTLRLRDQAGATAGNSGIAVRCNATHVGDQFSFLPWVRNQLGRAAGPVAGRPRPGLDLRLTTEISDTGGSPATDLTTVALEIYGPGDVVGLNPAAILRTTPAAEEQNFSPLHLASIEFPEEDLPWRYSFDSPTAANQVRPWCFLLVLEASEFRVLAQGSAPLPGIEVAIGVPLPDPDKLWLWAHVQANQVLGTSEAEVQAFLDGPLRENPALAFSRLFSPRRLKPNTAYQAFLLPTYEAGRQAGLGETPATPGADPAELAWLANTAGLDARRSFPVYHQWGFQTGAGSDFESLARRLQPATVTADARSRELQIDLPLTGAGGSPARYTLPMPGVLEAVNTVAPPLPAPLAQSVYAALRPGLVPGLVGSGGRPVVAPPLYGRAYLPATSPTATSGAPDVAPLLAEPAAGGAATGWLAQTNLDPRYRVVAGLGSQLVQEQQEEYVRRAWDQVQDLLVANLNLRSLQVGLEASSALRRQHLPVTGTLPFGAGRAARPAEPVQSAMRAADGSATAQATGAMAPVGAATLAVAPAQAVRLANYGVQFTGAALARVRQGNTGLSAREAVRRSDVPLAILSPTFRRLLRPFGPYQVNQVGRPLRPTQSTDPATADRAATEPLGRNTSLRQRDELLTELQAGRAGAAAPKAASFRAYQFDDAALNSLLTSKGNGPTELRVRDDQGYRVVSDAARLGDFGTAYAALRARTRFRLLDPPLPPLDLATVKSSLVAGTNPERVLPTRAGQALVLTPRFVTGDFATADFAEADFLVDPTVSGVTISPSAPPQSAAAAKTASAAAATAAKSTLAGQADNGQPASATTNGAALTTARVMANETPIKPLTVAPVYKDPLGEELRRRHPQLLLAGLDTFPADGVALMQINRAFIEAYLLGANHALGSELLWRDFPVDVRASFFRQFWDVRDFLHTQPVATPTPAALAAREEGLRDVAPLHTWGSSTALGQHPGAGPAAQVVLVVRAELMQRFPNTVICAQRAIARPGGGGGLVPDPNPFRTRYPVHRLPIGQDVVALAFDLTPEEALGTNPSSAGYFFVFLERPGEPQFGLDESGPDDGKLTLSSWNNLSWPYLGVAPGQNLVIEPAGKPEVTADPVPPVPHVRNSAELAYALFQQPVMVAIAARRLL